MCIRRTDLSEKALLWEAPLPAARGASVVPGAAPRPVLTSLGLLSPPRNENVADVIAL